MAVTGDPDWRESEVCMMAVHDTIEVDPDDFPYTQSVDLSDGVLLFTFQWNEIDQHFTVDVADAEGNDIRKGEVMILNQPLWRNINLDGLPTDTIIPMDESGNETEINPGNLGDTVQLCIDDIIN